MLLNSQCAKIKNPSAALAVFDSSKDSHSTFYRQILIVKEDKQDFPSLAVVWVHRQATSKHTEMRRLWVGWAWGGEKSATALKGSICKVVTDEANPQC